MWENGHFLKKKLSVISKLAVACARIPADESIGESPEHIHFTDNGIDGH